MSKKNQTLLGGLKAHYDVVLLILVLVLLLASAGFLMMRIGAEQSYLNSGQEVVAPMNAAQAEEIEPASVEALQDTLANPHRVPELERKLMISELRVRSVNDEAIPAPIPFNAEVCPFTGAEQPTIDEYDSDLDGMPDTFEERHGLNPGDPEDAYFDLDGDGFQNIEEYYANTSPSDETDFPSILAKLRLFGTRTKPFLMLFQGVQELPGGEARFQLNMRTRGKTHFAQMGDTVEGYKLVEYEPIVVTNGNRTINRSKLTVQQGESQVVLIKDQLRNISETIMGLISLLDKEQITTRVDEDFEYKGQQFRVLDLNAAGVVVEDLQTGETSTIARITPEERAALRGETLQEQGMGMEPGRRGTTGFPRRMP